MDSSYTVSGLDLPIGGDDPTPPSVMNLDLPLPANTRVKDDCSEPEQVPSLDVQTDVSQENLYASQMVAGSDLPSNLPDSQEMGESDITPK